MTDNPFDLSAINFSAANLFDAPLSVLVELYITECEAKNLQPMTIVFYRERLSHLVKAYGSLKTDSVTTIHLRTLLAHLRETRNWSPQNTNHAVQVWKSFFNYLEREEIIEKNPGRRLHKVRQEKKFPRPFSLEEITKLFAVMPSSFAGVRDKMCCIFLLDSGIRLFELTALQTDSIDLAHGVARVFGKGRKERFVPFSATTRRLLVRYLAARLSILKDTNPYETAMWITDTGKPMSQDCLQHNLREYAKKSGIDHVYPHRFRHTFATQFLINNGNPQMLQRILGHTTSVMTQRYVHVTDVHAKVNHDLASPVERWKLR